MNVQTAWLLKKYKEMSGDKKVQIGMDLSETVRDVWRAGEEERKKRHGQHSEKFARNSSTTS
jgi:hypothetical protein